MDKTERLNELNKKAIYSGFSGQPVVFVSKISRGMRRAKDGVYSDGETIYDGYADEEGDITAMFVVTNTGSAVELGEMYRKAGAPSMDVFYDHLIPKLMNREDVEVSPAAEDEEEGEVEEVTVDIYTRDSYDCRSGIAVRLEDVVPTEVMVDLIQQYGIDCREWFLEFMFTTFGEEDDRITEAFYRLSTGDSWIRAFAVQNIPEEEMQSFIDSAIPDILQSEVDWDRLLDTIKVDDEEDSEEEPETEPEIQEGSKILRPFRRK